MKIGWFLFAISGQSVNSQDQIEDDLYKITKARNEMVMAIGRIDNFIHGGLREKPSIGARSGVSRPQEVKNKLNSRMIKIQEKLKTILDICGPGANKEINKNENSNALDTFIRGGSFDPNLPGFPGGTYISGLGDGWIPGSDNLNQYKKLNQAGQTDASIYGGISYGENPMIGFGGFGHDDSFGLDPNFDPLGARAHFDSNHRRRKRFAENQKVTKGLIRKKVREMNKSFEPMEEFLSENLKDCSEERRARFTAKIEKTKARVEKVVNRQGHNLMKKNKKD